LLCQLVSEAGGASGDEPDGLLGYIARGGGGHASISNSERGQAGRSMNQARSFPSAVSGSETTQALIIPIADVEQQAL